MSWVIQNQPVSVKFPCSRCGAYRPQKVNSTYTKVQVLKCPCRAGEN